MQCILVLCFYELLFFLLEKGRQEVADLARGLTKSQNLQVIRQFLVSSKFIGKILSYGYHLKS